jgi:small subunit ribosomal protein S5
MTNNEKKIQENKKMITNSSTNSKKSELIVEKSKLEEKVVQIDRVARVVAGGRRFRFRAAVVVGDGAGKIGIGVAKSGDVSGAITKASSAAKKGLIDVPFRERTIPYQVEESFGGAHIFLKPASPGTGIIAGGPVRAVLEAAGIHDVLSKIIGSANKINNIEATFLALKKLKELEDKNKVRFEGLKTKVKKEK